MKKLLKTVLILLLLAALAFAGWFAWTGFHRADAFEAQESLEQKVSQVMSSPEYVPYDQVPQYLYQATIAVEDARYYEHGGLDYKAIVRAMISQVVPWMPKSGGSTIAQQTVKNLYHQYDSNPEWKAAEMVLAVRLEKICSKEEILSLYVNIINYGDNHHGIREASLGYFGIEPSQLSETQATLLAGIPQSPAYYQFSDHFAQAREKQKVVLQAMVRNKMITQEQADAIFEQPVNSYFGWADDSFQKENLNSDTIRKRTASVFFYAGKKIR